jgi:hypothetical protein
MRMPLKRVSREGVRSGVMGDGVSGPGITGSSGVLAGWSLYPFTDELPSRGFLRRDHPLSFIASRHFRGFAFGVSILGVLVSSHFGVHHVSVFRMK